MLRIAGVMPAWALTIAPFDYVETGLWGGLPITLILATFGLAFAFPSASWWRSAGAPSCR